MLLLHFTEDYKNSAIFVKLLDSKNLW